MKKLLKWGAIAVGCLMLLSIGAALGDTDEPESKPAVVASTSTDDAPEETKVEATVEESATPEPEPAPEPNPDGKYELICDYELGDDFDFDNPDAGYKFIGGGTLENTGNIGIRARVTYKWRLLGRGSKVETQTYKLRVGQQRDVDVLIPVTGEEIDAHQSADGDCSTNVKIVGTFGEVRD